VGNWGTCSKCGRDMTMAGTWGDPPVAKLHCAGCSTYEEFCSCRPLAEKLK
jgi:hypothetical protein